MSACDDTRAAYLASDATYHTTDLGIQHPTLAGLRALIAAHPECATCQDKANVYYEGHPEAQGPIVYEAARLPGVEYGPRDPLGGFTSVGRAAFLAQHPECVAWANTQATSVIVPPTPPLPVPSHDLATGTSPRAPWFVWAALGVGGGLLALEAWRRLQARGR